MERHHLISPGTRADDTFTLAEENQARVSQDGIRTPTTNENGQDNPAPRFQLRSSSYVLTLVSLYTALALLSWVVTCILTVRPITTAHYGVKFDPEGGSSYKLFASETQALYESNERWFQAAQVIQSIVAVFTIPLASTVCSKAAVIFVQRQNQQKLSLRQTVALADRGWTDPVIYIRLLSGGFKQYGSTLLILAILLNIIGGIITPLRSVFMTTKTIKTPTAYLYVPGLADIPRKLGTPFPDRGEIVVKVRSAMAAASNTNPQGRLWTGKPGDCSPSVAHGPGSDCASPSMSFAKMWRLPDPFLAELPSGYSTGLIRQYLPRINSTARRDNITEAEFPTNCDAIPGSLYMRYAATTSSPIYDTRWSNWSLEVCMPADVAQSPWRAVRSRQDFTEELYLNISLTSSYDGGPSKPKERGGLFRISLDTTAGYFELPNYMNGEQPGPLLDDDPICGESCYDPAQLISRDEFIIKDLPRKTQPNRGPLSTIALALFDNGSFIADRMARPEAFIYPNFTAGESELCVDRAPFLRLLRDSADLFGDTADILSTGAAHLTSCLSNDVHTYDDLQRQIIRYIHLLYWNPVDIGYKSGRLTNAFTSAAFLANEEWLSHKNRGRGREIVFDYGADTMVPVISLTGIIVVSVLLGIFLASLLALAIYSARAPRWTEQLDAFAMLRIGASIADYIQFRPTSDDRRIRALDELPGWVGDATGGEGELGALALGGPGTLDKERKFAAYTVETDGKEE